MAQFRRITIFHTKSPSWKKKNSSSIVSDKSFSKTLGLVHSCRVSSQADGFLYLLSWTLSSDTPNTQLWSCFPEEWHFGAFRFKEQSENELFGPSTAAHQLLLSNILCCLSAVFFLKVFWGGRPVRSALQIQTEFFRLTLMRTVCIKMLRLSHSVEIRAQLQPY